MEHDDATAPLLPTTVTPSNSADCLNSDGTVSPKIAMIRTTRDAVIMYMIRLVCLILFLAGSYLVYFGSQTRSTAYTSENPFPTFIGYEGPTPTGSEAMAVATSYPSNHDSYPLVPPTTFITSPPSLTAVANVTDFSILQNLGNLSPWYSVEEGTGQIPSNCQIEEVHLLHRHGARYPTTGSGSAAFAAKIMKARGFKASGALSFLNKWSYQLGAEILTPFGREQLFNLGVSFRVKYGGLLNSESPKAVFRTESQDRMLKSALNFAAGFFGIPYEDQYHQLITVEWVDFNNTLSPYMTCKNANRPDLNLAPAKMTEWQNIYLRSALTRISKLMSGFEFTIKDIYHMQELCAYELVALGGSAFCTLFTVEEWTGFEYASDIGFWYGYSFGQPAQAALGLGWSQEFLARLTRTPITVFNSTTNSSYHTEEYFPLDKGHKIFVDATHDTIVSAVITTLDFRSFAATGPPPSTFIPPNRSFITAEISPFAANLAAQVMSCSPPTTPSSGYVADEGEGTDDAADGSTTTKKRERFIRFLLNDAIVPLKHIPSCESTTCELGVYTDWLRNRLGGIDWAYDCLAPYSMPTHDVVDGRPSRD